MSAAAAVAQLPASMDGLQMTQPASTASKLTVTSKDGHGNPPCFTAFNKQTKGLHGYDKDAVRNLKAGLRKKEKDAGSKYDFEHFELGRASRCPVGNSSLFAVATDTPEASQHFLSIMDGEMMLADATISPLVCYSRVEEHISDLRWLNEDTLLASTGKGNLKLYVWEEKTKSITHMGNMPNACTSYIREMAVQPGTANMVALGGFDQKFNLLDLNRPNDPYIQRLDMQGVIGTVKWAPFHNAAYVSTCLDEGKFYLFDARTRIDKSTFYVDTRKEDLYTHERYNEYGVLLGYGDGEMKHIDMRKPNQVVHTLQDPFVEAIGNIEFNAAQQAFVVSGYTDFTVWKLNELEPTVHSHSENSDNLKRGDGYACSATWYDSTTVLSTDNVGAVGLYIQDFE